MNTKKTSLYLAFVSLITTLLLIKGFVIQTILIAVLICFIEILAQGISTKKQSDKKRYFNNFTIIIMLLTGFLVHSIIPLNIYLSYDNKLIEFVLLIIFIISILILRENEWKK